MAAGVIHCATDWSEAEANGTTSRDGGTGDAGGAGKNGGMLGAAGKAGGAGHAGSGGHGGHSGYSGASDHGGDAQGGSGGATSCLKKSCAELGAQCGAVSDGCGAIVDCGTCVAPATCGGSGTLNVCGGNSCALNAEVLDGKDNNCNGETDEGFWAVGMGVSYATLTGVHPYCYANDGYFSSACNAAISRHCRSVGYTSGFGPVEWGLGDATIVCVADASYQQGVPVVTLTAIHEGCTNTTMFSMPCRAAIRRYCLGLGYVGGLGPTEHDSAQARVDLVCTIHGQEHFPTWSEFAAQHDGCALAANFSPPCNAATERLCGAKGYAAGYGPDEYDAQTAGILCLTRQ